MKRIGILAALLFCFGCALSGTSRPFEPGELVEQPGWVAVSETPFVKQKQREDCGVAALAMIFSYWRVPGSFEEIKATCPPIPERGIRAGELQELARSKGLRVYLFSGKISDLQTELSQHRPVLVGMVKSAADDWISHYEVVVAIHSEKERIVTLDPAAGWRQNSFDGFRKEWELAGSPMMVFFRKGESL